MTPEKIARWKDTERGPGKLREAVQASSVVPSLRAQAMVALVEIGMASEALDDLKKSPDAERQAVVKEIAPRLTALASGSTGADTTRVQREAKDALFLLRNDAAPDDKTKIDDALIAWTTVDLNGRSQQGGQATEKILTTIGPRALPRLTELLAVEGPNQLTAAALIGRLGDAAAKARAADVLVESARKLATRTRDVPDALLRAIANIGGPHASAFLIDQAEKGSEIVRERAVLALGQGASLVGDSAALASAIRLAADPKAPGKVRDAAFEVAEKVGPEAVPSLLKLMNAPEEIIRWRSIEAALAAGKEKAIQPVLDNLAFMHPYKKEDVDSYIVHDLQLLGAPAIPAIKLELKSRNWVAKVSAIRALALIGKAEDAAALAPLVGDSTPVPGFPPKTTLGSEAKAAQAALSAKK